MRQKMCGVRPQIKKSSVTDRWESRQPSQFSSLVNAVPSANVDGNAAFPTLGEHRRTAACGFMPVDAAAVRPHPVAVMDASITDDGEPLPFGENFLASYFRHPCPVHILTLPLTLPR